MKLNLGDLVDGIKDDGRALMEIVEPDIQGLEVTQELLNGFGEQHSAQSCSPMQIQYHGNAETASSYSSKLFSSCSNEPLNESLPNCGSESSPSYDNEPLPNYGSESSQRYNKEPVPESSLRHNSESSPELSLPRQGSESLPELPLLKQSSDSSPEPLTRHGAELSADSLSSYTNDASFPYMVYQIPDALKQKIGAAQIDIWKKEKIASIQKDSDEERKSRETFRYNKLLRDNNGSFVAYARVRNAMVEKKIFNFSDPILRICKSTAGDEGVYQLSLNIMGRRTDIFLLQNKSGQSTYLKKKLYSQGGMVFIEKPIVEKKFLEQFWVWCKTEQEKNESNPVIVPICYGWCKVDEKLQFYKKGECKLWKEIIALAK